MGWIYQIVEGTMGQCFGLLQNLIDVFKNPKRLFDICNQIGDLVPRKSKIFTCQKSKIFEHVHSEVI